MPNNTFNSIPSKINAIGTRIVDSAIKVHKALGPGLLESVSNIWISTDDLFTTFWFAIRVFNQF